jgi:AcrR family transcriptional regulator
MSRWEPNARGRLAQAALELYGERGFDQVTAAEIAQRAGLSERTFFRHFEDKREVFSYGAALLQEQIVEGVVAAPDGLAPLDVVGAAVEASSDMFGTDCAFAARRQAILAANPELHERELIKLAKLSAAVAEALRQRGVTEPAATLAAEAGVAVFKVAYQRWADSDGQQTLPQLLAESRAALKEVTAGH